MSKGGSTSSTVAVPEYIEDAARRNLTSADLISKIGFIPEYGPTVAAFTPMQEAAFQGTSQAAGAFGLPGGDMSMRDISGGMPEPTTYAGGVRGYSSLPIYEQALEAFGEARPGQKRYVDSFFIDPVTGVPGSNMQAPVNYTVAPTPGDLGGISAGAGGGGDSYSSPIAPAVDVPFTIPPVIQGPYIDDPTDGFDDSLSSNTPVLTTDELRSRIEEEERLRQEDARRRADELAARANANPDLAGLDNNIFLQNQLEGGSSIDTGSYLPGFSAEETNAAAFDPRGPSQIPGSTSTGLFTGGGADNVGNFGQVGDFFGGIGDALGITDYSGQGGGLLSGLNVTGPVTPSPAPAPQVFEGPIATGTTLPTGSTISNTYSGGFESRPSHSTDNQSNASQLREAAARAAELENLASVLDTKEKMQAYSNSESRNFDTVDIAAAQMKKGGTGIIYRNDRREVYVNGVMVGNPKSADSAKKILARELAKKES